MVLETFPTSTARRFPIGRKTTTLATFAVGVSAADRAHEPPSSHLLAAVRDCLWGLLGHDEELVSRQDGTVTVRLTGRHSTSTRYRIASMANSLTRRPLLDAGERRHVDVGVAWTTDDQLGSRGLDPLADEARIALGERDLRPRRWTARPAHKGRRSVVPRTGLQFAIVLLVTGLIPFLLMVGGLSADIPVADTIYLVVIATIVISATLQWVETILGVSSRPDPPNSQHPAPPATAIIAAYLPNEAATILSTVREFVTHRYAGGLQVILAYNTPNRLPVEDDLAALAAEYPNFLAVRVPGSTSKAHNVNAALGAVTGAFVGIFDADHQPDPGSFERAWRWIDSGVDVVQGHCVIRNGDDSAVARTVAVEFEQIYAVSHRGRQLLHGFGVFGGSNGYWRTDLIRAIRMSPAMLTEDIDASLRAVRAGARIINDPGLISRELAPDTVRALWRQRMRWAQGWAQATAVHLEAVLLGDELNPHQRLGMFFHLLWREAFPVVSVLMWPTLAFYAWRDGGIGFDQPALVLLTVFTIGTAPLPLVLTRLVADRSIARRTGWWWWYTLVSLVVYQEFKNTIARIALVKLAMGERIWVVTPRGRPGVAADQAHPALRDSPVVPRPPGISKSPPLAA